MKDESDTDLTLNGRSKRDAYSRGQKLVNDSKIKLSACFRNKN